MNQQEVFTLFCNSTEIITGSYSECALRVSWEMGGYLEPDLPVREVTAYEAIKNGFWLQPVRSL